LIFPGSPGVHSEACRQSSGVLSAESEFSLQGSTRWADITRVTSVQPAHSATLSSCATLTCRTTRGRLTIPRRHRTRNWVARASRDSYPSARASGRFSSPCVSRRAASARGFRPLRAYPLPLEGGEWDRHPLEPPVRCTCLEVAAIVALGLGRTLRLGLTRTAVFLRSSCRPCFRAFRSRSLSASATARDQLCARKSRSWQLPAPSRSRSPASIRPATT
jgi:hypothetical protein